MNAITWPFPEDTEFEDHVLTGVETEQGDTPGYVLRVGSLCLWIADPGFEPKAGQTARYYGRGLGAPVRGVVIDGRVARYESPADYKVRCDREHAEYEEKRRLTMLEPKLPVPQIEGFEWTEDMREVSGFGGGYERECRAMISRGCLWLQQHPDADPQFHGFKGVTGLIMEDNQDAKDLSAAIVGKDEYGCTGAMHQAAVSHVMYWRRVGSWAAYQTEMRQMRNAEVLATDDA